MITDALMWKLNPDIVISNGFRFCPPLYVKPGEMADITVDYLYSMVPLDTAIITAEATGQQIRDWLEKELENVFAKDPTQRLGGWLVRFQGMKIRFSIEQKMGHRILEILVKDEKIDPAKTYRLVSCEREGDPPTLLCRMRDVKNNHKVGLAIHPVLEEYIGKHSPISPVTEGRVVATDAPPTLLTQVSGVNYQFR